MKPFHSLFLLFLLSTSHHSFSQNCYEISKSRDKEKGRDTYYGHVNSDMWYVSAGRQFYRKDSISPNFYLLLYTYREKPIDKFTLVSFRKMRVQLLDKSMLVLDSMKYDNDPLLSGKGFSVKVYLTEEEMMLLNEQPIVRVHFDEHEVNLSKYSRAKFLRIINCLAKQD